MISYGAMLGKIKKAILGNDEGDTKKLLELQMDTWIDEAEDLLKENTVYQEMLEKISKYEEQVQTMGLSKEKRKTIDAYVTEVSERWILYSEWVCQVFCVSFKKKIYGEGNLPIVRVLYFYKLTHQSILDKHLHFIV